MKIKTNSLEPGVPKDSIDCSVFKIFQAFGNEDEILDLNKGCMLLSEISATTT